MSAGRRAEAVQEWFTSHDPVEGATLSRRTAVGLTLVLYVAVFGPGVYKAIELYRDEHVAHVSDLAGAVVTAACTALLAVLAGLAIVRCLTGTWRPVAGAASWRREVVAGSLLVVLMWVSGWLMALLPHHGFPIQPTDAGRVVDAVGFLRSGPLEEVCALLAPLIILRSARVPWPWVFALLVVIRISYHVYYGFGAVAVVLWSSGAVVVYLWARSIIGLAIAHSLYDLSTLPEEWHRWAVAGLLHALLILFCLVVSVRFGRQLAKRRRQVRSEQRGRDSLAV